MTPRPIQTKNNGIQTTPKHKQHKKAKKDNGWF